jgi:hypothetical protein
MDLHITTQYRENYGTEEAPYWKFKGGTTYVVEGFNHPLTSGIGAAAQALVNQLRPTIERADAYVEEYILDWELVSSGTLTEDERLEQEYDGHIAHPSPRLKAA